MFEDYKKAVLNFYQEKKAIGQLSEAFENPTQAKLRKECLLILENRYLKKDDETIKAFFDPDHKFNDHELSIQKFDLDGFKALLKFFLGQPGIRKEENVKLLAWLIDFEIRPYKDWKAYHNGALSISVLPNPDCIDIGLDTREEEQLIDEVKGEDIIGIQIEEPLKDGEQGTKDEPVSLPQSFISDQPEQKVKSKFKNTILIFVFIAIAGGGSYAFLKNTDQCMYWTGHQYQAVGCSVKVDHASVIALDQHKIDRLKRITRLDTIAEKDLGKVWYVKIKQDSAEFYTDSGNYPLNNKKVLMPMTKYILDKYILHK